jgi:tRNA threonylcarbamoyladenosine biosynthesis protein TsaB
VIVLGIETAGPQGSVALVRSDGHPSRQIDFQSSRRLGAELAPAIQRLLKESGLGANTPPDLITVDTGPGSYTGLRIGLAAAKGLAFAWSRPLIGVPSTHALVFQVPSQTRRVLCALDASRGQIYAALFTRDDPVADFRATLAASLSSVDALSAELEEETYVIGDAAEQLSGVSAATVAPAELAWPSATRIAEAGLRAHLDGDRHDALRLSPIYYRPSEADEQRRKRAMRAS